MVNPIGIIQGRLTPSQGKLQCFPDALWREEFSVARDIGLDFIELISDPIPNEHNPLWSGNELEVLKEKSLVTRAGLVSMTIDHIMFHLLTGEGLEALESLNDVKKIVARASEAGVKTVVLPLLEKASIKGFPEKIAKVPKIISELIEASHNKVTFALECDLSVAEQLQLVAEVNSPQFGMCYDTGNRTYFGFTTASEILELGEAIVHVHIKDKLSDGKNVMLGTGKVDFGAAVAAFKKINYLGPYTMETCRGDNEAEAAKANLAFLKKLL